MTLAFLDNVHADPWSEEFVDLPSLNADASEALEAVILELRRIAKTRPASLRSVSTVVLGPPGAGKTHLFSRLRRRLGPRAVFVHIRPLVGSEMTPRLVLSEITKQLGYATDGLRQIDALVGYVLAHVSGQSKAFPRALLEVYRGMEPVVRAAKLEVVLEQLLGLWPESDEVYLRRLLQVPFETAATRRALLAWLSGRDCDAVQLARIGASAPIGEEVLMHALKTLSAVAALGAPLVLVFDQLENLIESQGISSRLAAYAALTSDLVDTLRGLAIVHMALDTEWAHGIEPTLNLAQRSRLVMKRVTLELPSSRQREDLLRVWLSQLPSKVQPFPWPLREQELERLLKAPGLTPRMLLLAYRRALQEDADPVGEGSSDGEQAQSNADASETETDQGATTIEDALEQEWKQCLSAARTSLDQGAANGQPTEPERLADGLVTAARFVEDLSIAVTRMKDPAQLRATGSFGERRIALAQQTRANSLGSVLNKLASLARQASVLVVREQVFDLPPTWKSTLEKRRSLLSSGAVYWLSLEREDTARLLSLVALSQAARSSDVTDREGRVLSPHVVDDWILQHLKVPEWRPLRVLLEPAADVEEEAEPVKPREEGPGSGSANSVSEPAGSIALLTLLRLRVASVDRLLREVNRLNPKLTRNDVLAELQGYPDRARFIGRSLVCASGER